MLEQSAAYLYQLLFDLTELFVHLNKLSILVITLYFGCQAEFSLNIQPSALRLTLAVSQRYVHTLYFNEALFKVSIGRPHIAAHLQAHRPTTQSQPAKELQFLQHTKTAFIRQNVFSSLQTGLMRHNNYYRSNIIVKIITRII